MKLLKVLEKGMKSPFQDFQYKRGRSYVCEDFDDNPKHECQAGFYATGIEGLPYSFNIKREVWQVEVGGRRVEIDEFKRRYERIEILRQVPFEEVKELALAAEEEVGYKLAEVLFPVNPLLVKRERKLPSEEEVKLLEDWVSVGASVWDSVGTSVWASVWDSVRASIWASIRTSIWASIRTSVGASVWASVRDSVGDSVRDSVWASVWDSVGAYSGSLFPNISKWNYVQHKVGEYPFQPGADLWRSGLVPSYDGNTWRLHTGEDAKVVLDKKILTSTK